MPRITRLPCPLSDTSNTIGTQDCRTNRQIFQRLDLLSRIKSFHGSGSTFTKSEAMELRRQGIFDFSLFIICSISTAPRLFYMYIHSYNNNSALDRFINCFKLLIKILEYRLTQMLAKMKELERYLFHESKEVPNEVHTKHPIYSPVREIRIIIQAPSHASEVSSLLTLRVQFLRKTGW